MGTCCMYCLWYLGLPIPSKRDYPRLLFMGIIVNQCLYNYLVAFRFGCFGGGGGGGGVVSRASPSYAKREGLVNEPTSVCF